MTICSWAYRFLEGLPEVEECHDRLRLAIVRIVEASGRAVQEDGEEHTESLAELLAPEQLHKVWHESVLGIDASTRKPLEFFEVFRDDLR